MTSTNLQCCCPPPDEATLLLSEDFEGETLTNPDLTYWSSTPDAYGDENPIYTTINDLTCAHYYVQEGTNEKTPLMLSVEKGTAERIVGAESFAELCLEWKEYFEGGYPWPHGQKIMRCGFDNENYPDSKKSFDLACLDNNGNLQVAHYIGLWGSDAHGAFEWWENTGEPHPEDSWITWRVWLKLNTPGESDGFVRLTQNGAPFVTAEGLNLRGTDERGWNWIWWGGNYSNLPGEVLPHDGHRFITGIRWYSTNPG